MGRGVCTASPAVATRQHQRQRAWRSSSSPRPSTTSCPVATSARRRSARVWPRWSPTPPSPSSTSPTPTAPRSSPRSAPLAAPTASSRYVRTFAYHGIPVELVLSVMAVANEFFRLPAEEKAKLYSDDPAKKMRLSTSFNVRKETVHNWRDYLRLHCYPLEHFVPDWPPSPPSFREIMSTYCKEVRELGFRLYGAISESLGLEQEYIKKVLGEQEQHMAVNFYPKCPEPELTYGLPAHTDPNALTILLMDQQVAGLQVLKEGRWIAVNPQPNALVINIGDQLQALSNGRYKSVWHRAVVNSDRARMSIASFLCPCNDVLIGPAQKLIGDGSPAVYRNYTYAEYYQKFWSRNLDQEHCLELFRTN